MNAIAMAFEADMLAAVQSSQSRMAIRESCTRICDVILVVNDILRIIQDAVLAVLLCKCLFHISVLLCDGSSHISVGAHSEFKLSVLATLDVPAAMDKWCASQFCIYPLQSCKRCDCDKLKHKLLSHLLLNLEWARDSPTLHHAAPRFDNRCCPTWHCEDERQPLCPRYISESRHEFSATLLKYMTTPVSVVDSGELFSLRTFHSAMKAALRPEATCSDINPQVSTILILKKMYVLLCT